MELNCVEKLSPEYIISEASADEILKLKPLMDLRDGTILGGHPSGFTRYYFVSGGFAAYVAGRTNTYDDIDIYTDAKHMPRRLTYLDYPDIDIDYIYNKYPFQYIHTTRKHPSIQEYIKTTLSHYDMDLCAVAYWYPGRFGVVKDRPLKYYKCERKKDLAAKDVIRFSPKRIRKYASRVKTPFNLKLLSLSSVLEFYDLNDVNKYLNKIDLSF